jgi:anaerobic selenocysteine-containing dehydrogenase
MTRRASVLDALEPRAVVSLHPLDLDALGAKGGDVITVASRRGEIALAARADDGIARGAVFIPFAFYEAAANRPHQRRARSVRQDRRGQVLRGEGEEGRQARAPRELRRGQAFG